MGSERPSDSRGAWPPPSTSRYRSKACLGAMFHAKSFEDAGAPPICVGFSYRKTAPMPPTDPAAAHGSFKFTCVGYGQRAIEDTAERAGRRLPYCEGLQILVADATQVGRHASGDRRPPAADPLRHFLGVSGAPKTFIFLAFLRFSCFGEDKKRKTNPKEITTLEIIFSIKKRIF